MLMMLVSNTTVLAQYKVGNDDGFSNASYTQANFSLPIFAVGNDDGFAGNSYTQAERFAIYAVGNDDGFSENSYTQANFSLPIFAVGNDDGFAENSYTQAERFAVYAVGNDDGFAENSYTQANFSLPIFAVGNDDGFAIGSVDSESDESSLPVALLWLAADCETTGVILKWVTASETNNDFFSVERSVDAVNFELLGTVAGAGNSNQTLDYSFPDHDVFNDIVYYRLKQTDFDGQFDYSEIIAVNCNIEPFSYIKAYPNPITQELLTIESTNSEQIGFEIVNSIGTVVYRGIFVQKTSIQMNGFAKGIYIIKFSDGKNHEFKKIIKE